MPVIGERNYSSTVGSDIERDGMFIEIGEDGTPLAEAFYSDATGEMTVTTFGEDVRIEALEWLITEARRRLPPSKG